MHANPQQQEGNQTACVCPQQNWLTSGMGLLRCFCLFRFLGRLCALVHIRTMLSSVGAHATPGHKLVNLFAAGCEKLGLWMVTLAWVQMLQWNRCSHRSQRLAEMALSSLAGLFLLASPSVGLAIITACMLFRRVSLICRFRSNFVKYFLHIYTSWPVRLFHSHNR